MNNKITQEEIENIRQSVDIVDVISSYIPLTNKGKNFFGVCPFHSDHSPSMSVSREKQIYKCFACGASGNVINFVKEYENINFFDAVKLLADKAGISINIDKKDKKEDNNQVLYNIFDIAQKLYKNNINTQAGKSAREYIEKRNFDLSIIKDFDIGLSLEKDDILTTLLLNKKYTEKDMLRTGLINKSERGLKDTYINRIMFPIEDLNGHLVAYSGRIYNGENANKYFNTKETEIFKKGEILYNYSKAKQEAREKNQIIIVEGFFALITLYTIGIKNVVATLGTAFTSKHALIIKRMASEVILCFDGDSAGDKATNSCIEILNKVGIIPKVIRLEDKLDPDDYIIKYGKSKMIEKINNPISVMDYKLKYYKNNKNLTDNQDLSEYINEILKEINNMDDAIYQELTLKKLADEASISIDILKNKLNSIKEPKKEIPKIDKNIKMDKYTLAEKSLLYYMLNSKEVVKMYEIEKPKFENENYYKLATIITDYVKKYNDIKVAALLTYYYDNEEIIKIINDVLELNLKDNYKIIEIDDYIRVLNEKNINDKISKLKNQIKDVSNDDKKKILNEILKLKKEETNGDELL